MECTLCLKVKKKLHNIEFISFELMYINFHPAYLSQGLWQQALQGSLLSYSQLLASKLRIVLCPNGCFSNTATSSSCVFLHLCREFS